MEVNTGNTQERTTFSIHQDKD